jgi:hypothetical protein
MKFRFDVLATGETSWANNALEYDTPAEAEAAAYDLFYRWFLVEKFRVVPTSTPTRETYQPGSETGPK